ncbi:hypothetical protein SAMN05421810_106126 [Amycolatopsis arida]|uniref:DUF6292 domain-containing protein n=2 Tax=Amycolatopsis arida TaxID=587909 RepID=A0A1I5XKQ9_9PSEU|nr:hypothetical protein CLV69_102495 [Amycolatopsis arida]SFQ32396.1 hypothetical protein SAMN05421810_106126 [Amycolatopsis arida]
MARGLAAYVRTVAEAVGVPEEAVDFEVSDTATAYLGLARRWRNRPEHDLMLVWSERHGWSLAAETEPTQDPVVLAHFGPDLVPAPAEVARFVTDVLAGHGRGRPRPDLSVADDRARLTELLGAYLPGPR